MVLRGLTNNDRYQVLVSANGVGGRSVVSHSAYAKSDLFSPGKAPDAPTNVVVTPGDQSASVAFTAPAANGLNPFSYMVTTTDLTDPTAVVPSSSSLLSPVAVSGLVNGHDYSFTVTAFSSIFGAGVPSPASDPVRVAAPPNAPDNIAVTSGDQAMSVSFDESITNGTPVTSYRVTATDISVVGLPDVVINGLTSPLTTAGMTNGHTTDSALLHSALPGPVCRRLISTSPRLVHQTWLVLSIPRYKPGRDRRPFRLRSRQWLLSAS